MFMATRRGEGTALPSNYRWAAAAALEEHQPRSLSSCLRPRRMSDVGAEVSKLCIKINKAAMKGSLAASPHHHTHTPQQPGGRSLAVEQTLEIEMRSPHGDGASPPGL